MTTRHEELREEVGAFHREHPEVWTLFVRFAFEKIHRGYKHYGAKGVMERVRWETDAGEKGADGKEPFRLNNNYFAFYARAFATQHPEHADFFRFREQISKRSES